MKVIEYVEGCGSAYWIEKGGCMGPNPHWKILGVSLDLMLYVFLFALFLAGMVFVLLYFIKRRDSEFTLKKNVIISLIVFGVILVIGWLFFLWSEAHVLY